MIPFFLCLRYLPFINFTALVYTFVLRACFLNVIYSEKDLKYYRRILYYFSCRKTVKYSCFFSAMTGIMA